MTSFSVVGILDLWVNSFYASIFIPTEKVFCCFQVVQKKDQGHKTAQLAQMALSVVSNKAAILLLLSALFS